MKKFHNRVAIIGTVGVPGNYGGFETLADNLIDDSELCVFDVYCSYGNKYEQPKYKGAYLHYIPIKANGIQSIFYDIFSIIDALLKGYKNILMLGISGALILPFIKFLKIECFIVCNIDGLEWKREKWNKYIKRILKFFEMISVKYSDQIISDNYAIQDYVKKEYGKNSNFIAYGGDHVQIKDLPEEGSYALALCRIEPENNIEMILESFFKSNNKIIFVGNWDASNYGKRLRHKYLSKNISLLDPIYDEDLLSNIRSNCSYYVHGHSAGGTNPSLVEMMFYSKPIIAYDCAYNRHTLNNLGNYFNTSEELYEQIKCIKSDGKKIKEYANNQYTWEKIRDKYKSLFVKINT